MVKDFYIFRHGETDLNKAGCRQGQKIDAELNETGIKQAEDLATRLEGLDIEIIFSSPLKRARKTAEIVLAKIGTDIIFEDNLMEGCFGIFEGLYKEEIKEKYLEEAKCWDSMEEKYFDYRLPNSESKREISDRFFEVLERLIKTDYKKIAISTHGRITRLLLYRFGLKSDSMGNASLYHIRYDAGKWIIMD